MDLENPCPPVEQEPGILELLPYLLEDSGYMIMIDNKLTHISYMHPELYLKLLRGPSWKERLYYRWMDMLWTIFHPSWRKRDDRDTA